MSARKNEALGSLRTADSISTRFLTLGQPHHWSTVSDVSESLFDYRDGIALLQQERFYGVRFPLVGDEGDH